MRHTAVLEDNGQSEWWSPLLSSAAMEVCDLFAQVKSTKEKWLF